MNTATGRPSRILVVDNYDSFVYNLVQYLYQLGAECEVLRNDAVRPGHVAQGGFDGVLLSPGPGTPERAGVCVELIRREAGRLPIFGVCLGLQAIGEVFGGMITYAPELMHGKTSVVIHDEKTIFHRVPQRFTATRKIHPRSP
jgi:para-aminobenzoate synthetase component 2